MIPIKNVERYTYDTLDKILDNRKTAAYLSDLLSSEKMEHQISIVGDESQDLNADCDIYLSLAEQNASLIAYISQTEGILRFAEVYTEAQEYKILVATSDGKVKYSNSKISFSSDYGQQDVLSCKQIEDLVASIL